MLPQDPAFLDRVDVKQFVPEPSGPAAYAIMRSCIVELQRCGIIARQPKDEGQSSLRTEDSKSEATFMVTPNDHQVPRYNVALLGEFDPNAVGTKLLAIAERCKVCSNPLLILHPADIQTQHAYAARCLGN